MERYKHIWSWLPTSKPVYQCTKCGALNWFDRELNNNEEVICKECNINSKYNGIR